MSHRDSFTPYALLLVFFAALGSFLFGYTTGVISGALSFLAMHFSLSIFQEGMVVSAILIGAFAGSCFAGALADHFGRRKTILLTGIIFILGILASTVANSYLELVIGRGVTGVAVGIISMAAPLYLSEIAPPHSRGAFVSVHQFSVAVGILFAYSIDYLFSSSGNWRLMFGCAAIPAVIQFVGMLFLPDTPSWLMAHGHTEKAKKVIQRLRKDVEWQKHLPEMKEVSSASRDVHWSQLFKFPLSTIFFVGIALSAFQQITGINTVIYYAPKIFQTAGFSSISGALLATFGIGIVNVLSTFLSIWLLDQMGRRRMLLIGVAGMVASLCMLVLALTANIPSIDKIAVISLMGYVIFFGIGLGPVTWVVLSEIYPLHFRGRAMGIATLINWLCNYLIILTFLDVMSALGSNGAFALFAVVSLICFWFIHRFIPETKGKSLEKIEESFREHR